MKISEYSDYLLKILQRSSLSDDEVAFRIHRLKEAERKPGAVVHGKRLLRHASRQQY